MDYDKEQTKLVEWIASMAPWDAFGTFTFALPESVTGATRQFERWKRKSWPGVPTFYAVEWHGGGHQAHIHSLMRLNQIRRKEVWGDWFNRFGRALIVPPETIGGVAGYCAKYCLKETFDQGWWNLLNVQREAKIFEKRIDSQ